MNEEQLLQEARIEAEKVYPKNTPSHYSKSREDNVKKQTIFIKGYIANAKKRESEAVRFAEWIIKRLRDEPNDVVLYNTSKDNYQLFLQQQKQE